MDLQHNLTKAEELLPECQYAAKLFLNDCYNQKLFFTVSSVYRTQEEQNALYARGRTKPGNIVTWTLTSKHTQRLAMDIVVENCTYEQVMNVAWNYGIYRDPALVKLGDIGHFEFDKCIKEPAQPNYAPSAIIRRLQRLIAQSTGPLKDSLLQRLKNFLSSSPK